MIEFFIIRALYRKLAGIAVWKNRPRSWGWLGVALWILGEVLGFMVVGPNRGGTGYLYALMGAGIGTGLSFAIVNSLSTLPPEDFPTASIHKG